MGHKFWELYAIVLATVSNPVIRTVPDQSATFKLNCSLISCILCKYVLFAPFVTLAGVAQTQAKATIRTTALSYIMSKII